VVVGIDAELAPADVPSLGAVRPEPPTQHVKVPMTITAESISMGNWR
jgi:hypothetical protein